MMQPSLFEGSRAQMTDSIRAALESLNTYGPSHDHWAIAWSGGKDSTALLTFAIWAVLVGKVKRPRSITVLYADTRMEIPPLWYAARTIRDELEVAAEDLAAVAVDLRVEVVMQILVQQGLVTRPTGVAAEDFVAQLVAAYYEEPGLGLTQQGLNCAITRAAQQYAPWAAEAMEEEAGELLYNYVCVTPAMAQASGIEID